ncbi:lipid-A-disaccharide synthase [Sulfurimonas sp. MAG313]|nr:lipid-A-disaccharide synthase [Sulfurimonas sp. MAG313]MDF1881262.1 lipid-A-disaccharide synthase [Sulfurimonas sp. MAG313]
MPRIPTKPCKLLVSALEPSSNLHLKALYPHLEEAELCGIFDESLGNPLYSPKEFSVMGIKDVIGKIFAAKEAIAELVFLAKDADKVLLIDAPAFNLPLAKKIKEKYPDKEISYYVLPKVWAWKKKRAQKVDKYCDNLLSIFPFENEFYPRSIYVGNPLMDEIKVCKGSVSNNKKIAFLAGSRKSEVRALMPIYHELRTKHKEEALLVIPPHFSHEEIEDLYGDLSEFTVIKNTHEALLKADFAYVCSGTATLECSLIGTPMVLVFVANKLEYWIGRKFVKLKHVGLANIIYDFQDKEEMHIELLQDEVTVEKMYEVYKNIDKEKFLKRSIELRTELGKSTLKDVAEIILRKYDK